MVRQERQSQGLGDPRSKTKHKAGGYELSCFSIRASSSVSPVCSRLFPVSQVTAGPAGAPDREAEAVARSPTKEHSTVLGMVGLIPLSHSELIDISTSQNVVF